MGLRTSPSGHHITSCLYLFIHLCTHTCHTACGILVPWPGIKLMSPEVEAWSPNLDSQGVPSSCLYYLLNSHICGLWLCPHWCLPTWIFLLRGPGHPVCPSQFLCPPQILNLLLPRDVLVLLSVPCHLPNPQHHVVCRGSSLSLLHGQTDSLPLNHLGSPNTYILFFKNDKMSSYFPLHYKGQIKYFLIQCMKIPWTLEKWENVGIAPSALKLV